VEGVERVGDWWEVGEKGGFQDGGVRGGGEGFLWGADEGAVWMLGEGEKREEVCPNVGGS
jgi:hypothetical protein